MQNINFIGWDIGGAHLKVASMNSSGGLTSVNQFATPLWQGIDRLEQAFPDAIKVLPQGESMHAVTMTAELVDIFNNRRQGVQLLSQLCHRFLGDKLNLYASKHGFIGNLINSDSLSYIASANWRASSELVARHIDSGLFIDVGSTTVDIIPVAGKKVLSLGYDDQTRLQQDELVYTGVIRTSLMAIAQSVPFAGQWQGITTEHFATTADIYRILGWLDEANDLMTTADGGNKSTVASVRRLARMVGVDAEHFPETGTWKQLASYFAELQLQLLARSIYHVMSRFPETEKVIIAAGAGRFLANNLAQRLGFKYLEFSDLLDCDKVWADKCNVCAPAVALAYLNWCRMVL